MDPSDAPRVKEIETVCRLSAWSEEDYRQESVMDEAVALVTTCGDVVYGFLIARLITNSEDSPAISVPTITAEINNIGVIPECRRQGIAKMMIAALEHHSRANELRSITLEVRESNGGAIAFYRSQGFRATGRRAAFYRHPQEDALVMEKHLPRTRPISTGETPRA